MKRIFLILTAVLAASFTHSAYSSHLISYQGRLTDGTGAVVVDSVYNVQFALYDDSTAGQNLWTENSPVVVNSGLFVHLLGSVNALDDSVFKNSNQLFLELTVESQTLLPRNRLTSVPFSVSTSILKMTDNNDKLAGATDSDERTFSLYDTSETEVIRLSGSDTANESVILPQSAIGNEEILDEPGLTAAINVNQVALFTGEMTDLVTLEITTPADGYILLHGKCYLLLSGTTGPNNAFVQIDDDEAGPSEFPYYTIAGLGGYANTGMSYFPIYVTRIFFRSAGTHEFRMEGRASFPPPAEAITWDHYLTAVYYPTAYNAVKSLMTSPAGFNNPNGIDIQNRTDEKENGLYFEVDLRELQKSEKSDNPNE